MFRTFILMFFTFFFFHLHASGNLTKYINMKYAYLSYIAIFLLAILTVVQFYIYVKGTDEKECHDCGCGHDHDHEKDKPFLKRMLIYFVFLFPLCTGLFLPAATLDSNIVKSKGFSFKAIEQPDNYAQTQYLRPDTSIYYGRDGYDELMEKALKKYKEKKQISLKDEDYLKGMETIYNYPGEFLDKTIEFNGFAFKGESINDKQLFVLRFGIIHCIADSGVYGMLVEFPKEMNIKDDQWLHVKGTLSSEYYQPFKSVIPVLKVTDWSKIKQPKDPYVYRTY
ncbi:MULTISPECIES: TIGR03943 family putative permease subunit [unclassified Bacillus (in: firmicutes)]|uniref:TIGR03943 family putative permease subunit n=1 Tax=unclassified Bacillus (in: firmicutes) TaxID=185979 RepID=UPI0004243EBE|nr:TIGR03943 family protein [Bacillus sp. NSP9.1]QHZ48680.1 TIGR03943 family protein [Bacillus sp. NSP9.1]